MLERSRPRSELPKPGLRVGLLAVLAMVALAAGADEPRRIDGVAGPVSAVVLRVIDGDTIAIRARIWIGQSVETKVRIAGVDTPELRGGCALEIELAIAARDLVVSVLGDQPATLRDVRYDKYGGRVLARVENNDGEDIAALLIAAGLGRPYDGGKRRPWCDEP
ncbi:MAG: nuclease [Proteobacteria bacterium]|nr:nuclease [Pseudomonadota bacterium]